MLTVALASGLLADALLAPLADTGDWLLDALLRAVLFGLGAALALVLLSAHIVLPVLREARAAKAAVRAEEARKAARKAWREAHAGEHTKEDEADDEAEDVLHSLLQALSCPITGEVMKDPVTTVDGYTYDRAAITLWLKRSNKSPMTGLPLAERILIPNWTAKQQIDLAHDVLAKERARKEAKQQARDRAVEDFDLDSFLHDDNDSVQPK